MTGLILKDLINLKKSVRSVGVVVIFFGIFGAISGDVSFLAGMIVLMAAMMSVTSFAYDDVAKWDRYALALPVSREEMVLAKYALALLLALGGTALSLAIACPITYFTHGDLTQTLLSVLAILGVALVFVSILLPMIYRFGVENSRLMIMGVVLVPVVAVFMLKQAGVQPLDMSLLLSLAKFSPLAVAALFCGSFFLSSAIYSKKEI